MAGVLLAEAAVLVHFKTIGVVLLVLHGIVITLLALGACHRNLNALIRCHLSDTSHMFCSGFHGYRGRRHFSTKTAAHNRGRLLDYKIASLKLQAFEAFYSKFYIRKALFYDDRTPAMVLPASI
jgi:hypothetical protein